MGELVQFPGAQKRNASARTVSESAWRLITIAPSVQCEGWFDVHALTGLPSDPASVRMYLGGFASLIEASDVALAKAKALSVGEIVDLTSGWPSDDEPPGDAA